MEERFFRAWMLAQEGIKSTHLERALDYFGSIATACHADALSWRESGAVKEERLTEFLRNFREDKVAEYAKRLSEKQVRLLLPDDPEYPPLLREIAGRPEVLYAKGEFHLTDQVCVAVVGSRRATQYGKRVAEQLARDMSDLGVCVVSGMARGIDSAAHRGALSATRGRTCAVIGTGIDIVYPTENSKLAEQILEQGLILSEFALGMPPLPYNFPTRNRIISGLSLGVLVVEAAEKSGSQITVNFALEQGREVFAVPGNIYSATAKGPHQLLKQGARLVESVDDILDELGLLQNTAPSAKDVTTENVSLTLLQQKILDLLEAEPQHFDQIQADSKLPVGTLLSELLQLEMLGLVATLPGRNYIRLTINN